MMIAAIGISFPAVVRIAKPAPTRLSRRFIPPIARMVTTASGTRQAADRPKSSVIRMLMKPATAAMIAGP